MAPQATPGARPGGRKVIPMTEQISTNDPRVTEIAAFVGETPEQVVEEAATAAGVDGVTVTQELDAASEGVALAEALGFTLADIPNEAGA